MAEDSDSGEKGSVHMRIIDLSQELYNGSRNGSLRGQSPACVDSDTRRTSDIKRITTVASPKPSGYSCRLRPVIMIPRPAWRCTKSRWSTFVTQRVVLDLRHKSARSEITVADLEQAMNKRPTRTSDRAKASCYTSGWARSTERGTK